MKTRIFALCVVTMGLTIWARAEDRILDPAPFKHYIDSFNSDDPEKVVNLIPNAKSWD